MYSKVNQLYGKSSTCEPSSCKLNNVNVRSHVQLHNLVHVSGIHCHVCASCTSGAFVYVQHCIEYSSILFQAQDVWKQAVKVAGSSVKRQMIVMERKKSENQREAKRW